MSEHEATMLSRLSDEVVRVQKEQFGKGPTRAKSYLVDDLLFVVMRGGMTTAERTLIDRGHHEVVRHFRQVYENEMADLLTATVEQVTGRKVANYQSQVMFDPDIILEVFVLDESSIL